MPIKVRNISRETEYSKKILPNGEYFIYFFAERLDKVR